MDKFSSREPTQYISFDHFHFCYCIHLKWKANVTLLEWSVCACELFFLKKRELHFNGNLLLAHNRKVGRGWRKTEGQKDRKTERQKDRKTEKQKDRKTERQKDRETERQKDRKTERQKDRNK
jgi:hypothetical protein